MAWIDTIDVEEAEGALEDVYDEIAGERGKIANIMEVQSLAPEAMLEHMELYAELLFGDSGLSREEREMIATVVSSANDCPYCVQHHGVALDAYWDDEALVERFAADWRTLGHLSDRQRAMLRYAEALTENPAAIGEGDVEALRDAGLEDEEILRVNLVASYFNFVNRIAEGLGVEATPEERSGYDY